MTAATLMFPGVVGDPTCAHARPVHGLVLNWDFAASSHSLRSSLLTAYARAFRTSTRPPCHTLRAVTPRDVWVSYFVFAPDGQLSAAHRFTLGRLRDSGFAVLVVCATRSANLVPDELRSWSDALYWKGLGGYDFSAYTLALEVIAEKSPGADVLLMNDSIYGPFHDLRPFIDRARWDLSGFTASSDLCNHIQSFAFGLRALTPERLLLLRSVFPEHFAFDRGGDAIRWQELRFAKVASRHMRVGAHWFNPGGAGQDSTLLRPFELTRAGFPFVKKSLLGKHSKFQRTEEVKDELVRFGHPV